MLNRKFNNFKQILNNLALINQLKKNQFGTIRAAAITSVLAATEKFVNIKPTLNPGNLLKASISPTTRNALKSLYLKIFKKLKSHDNKDAVIAAGTKVIKTLRAKKY